MDEKTSRIPKVPLESDHFSLYTFSMTNSPTGRHLPSGTVTFLFTDIEGSTKLAQQYPDQWESLRARHHSILQSAIDAHNGYVFQIIGDAFCVAFHTASDGMIAAIDSQRQLQNESWGETPIKVRMGLHTGSAKLLGNDYRGYLTMAKVQRIMSVAYGGQILLSNTSAELVRGELPRQVSLRDMSEHRLKGLLNPEHLWQVNAPGLPQEFPPLQSLNIIPTNLPVQLTSFVGREKEILEVKHELGKHRLVTLTGSGGTGKTRLSLQVAAEVLDSFHEGVWFVELAPLSNPDLIASTILSTLEISEQQGRPALKVLEEYLQPKTLLLILDNCEHLIAEAARVTEAILNAAPNLKILASSREALGVKGELSWHVPSLSSPDPNNIPELDRLTQYEAVRLFIDRASLNDSHFTVTKDNAPAIAQICYRLDGIPLALELAAARVKMLSVDQISARLDDRFRLLTGGARTALPRQQTLRSMIDWSYDLLSDSEKLLLRRLAVFAGGWTLELAEQVCSDDKIAQYEILDMLSKLVDKSLVAVIQNQFGARYRILETIRQYAREKLFESGEGEKIRDQHLKAFVELAEQAESETRGHHQQLWLDRLDNELENLRAALEWSQERDNESFLRLASALWRFWELHGYIDDLKWLPRAIALTEGMESVTRARALARASYENYDPKQMKKWADEAERLSRNLNDKSVLAMALSCQSGLEIRRLNSQSALALLEQALTVSKEVNDHWLSGIILIDFGAEALNRNAFASARSFIEQGLAEVSLSGDKRHKSRGLISLCVIAAAQGNAEKVRHFAREALACAQEIHDKAHIINGYGALFVAELILDEYPRAEQFALERYRLTQGLNDKWHISLSLINLGLLDWAQGNFYRFKERMQEALGVAKQCSEPLVFADVLIWAGISSLYTQDPSQAKSRFAEALAIYEEENNKAGYCLFLMSVGMLAIDQGLAEQGARLLCAREKLRRSFFTWDFYPFMARERERYITKAREQLGEEAFNKAWAEGAAMSTEEAIALALDQTHE